MKRWVISNKRADFNDIGRKYNISPMLARIIRNRDVIRDEDINLFINGSVSDMHDPALLKDMDKAAERIVGAITREERIRIIGDYDIDGICSSYILDKALSIMGANADVMLPDRIVDGYGLNINLIDKAKEDNINLIITCDNGIAAAAEIDYAAKCGIDVVVTDHHEVPDNFPKACAVVDPKRDDCTYPFKGICGAMVAYKTIMYITKYLGDRVNLDDFTEDVYRELLIFAAIATVGDVMELLDENRIAVRYGLPSIKHCSNVGLKALIEVCGLSKDSISAYHVGFVLGPCMNATGRLDSALRALELFKEKDYEKAVLIAQELKELNESRKNMTIMNAELAIKKVEQGEYQDDKVLVIYLPDCHESLAGIVAGRVRERFYRPTIILTKGSECIKGSGRSIEDYNMFLELSKHKDLFIKFGGHKMAAGLSIKEENIEILRERLNKDCPLNDEQLIEKYVIDIPMPISYATMDFAREINKLMPFGVGNPKPLFAQKDIAFDNLMLVGKNQNVLKMKLCFQSEDGILRKIDGIIFDDAKGAYEQIAAKNTISILYQIDINTFKDRENVQIVIKDWY